MWKRLIAQYDWLARIFFAKDLVLFVAGPTVVIAVTAPILVWFFTPASPIDLALVALLCGAVAFGLSWIFAPKVRHVHHHHATVQLQDISAKGVAIGFERLESSKPPLPLVTSQYGSEEMLRILGAQGPDWPIRNIFISLWPHLNKDDGAAFEASAALVRDKLSTGELACWGRQIIGSDRTALIGIPSDYWARAKLIPWLLDAGEAGKIWHSGPLKTNSPFQQEYADIQVNRAQAVAIWPAIAAARLSLHDAAAELYGDVINTILGQTTRDHCATEEQILNSIGMLILQRIDITGRRPPSPRIEPIDRRQTVLYCRATDGARAFRRNGHDKPILWTDLTVARAGFDALREQIKSEANDPK